MDTVGHPSYDESVPTTDENQLPIEVWSTKRGFFNIDKFNCANKLVQWENKWVPHAAKLR